jgi:hypothetical protein
MTAKTHGPGLVDNKPLRGDGARVLLVNENAAATLRGGNC